MILGIHVGYAQWQAIDAQLQVTYPQSAAHLALDVLLKVHPCDAMHTASLPTISLLQLLPEMHANPCLCACHPVTTLLWSVLKTGRQSCTGAASLAKIDDTASPAKATKDPDTWTTT